ncbi:MAG: hypothetical protein KAR87_03170 [Candidatus Aenigmarchaeota archaeon]|nr:hypothetical protein [Candidatus Aenigmarchaeota archaeon]
MLPKSMRDKKRYLLCRLINVEKKEGMDAGKEIRITLSKQIFSLYGDIGSAKTNAKIIQVKEQNKEVYFIVMCNYNHVEQVEFALANIKELNNCKIIINIREVSGTQKKFNTFLNIKTRK